MRVSIWGARGSIASAGPDTIRYGGNTSCVLVTDSDGTIIVLDAGTGIRALGAALVDHRGPVHILLSHLHMDHIQGLGFFRPFFDPKREIHVWGPPSTTADLRTRLTRYLSPPLFPMRIKELESHVELHDTPPGSWTIGGLEVRASSVIHPGPTVGYRITDGRSTVAYLTDHEPALGGCEDAEWTSGFALAFGADLLVHDAQYTDEEYRQRVGWGHSSVGDAVSFATRAAVERLVLFHHDPEHDDPWLDRLVAEAVAAAPGIEVTGAREGTTYRL
jgi:phosphoribosyl 1,2-cyclic phosphodiesterase